VPPLPPTALLKRLRRRQANANLALAEMEEKQKNRKKRRQGKQIKTPLSWLCNPQSALARLVACK